MMNTIPIYLKIILASVLQLNFSIVNSLADQPKDLLELLPFEACCITGLKPECKGTDNPVAIFGEEAPASKILTNVLLLKVANEQYLLTCLSWRAACIAPESSFQYMKDGKLAATSVSNLVSVQSDQFGRNVVWIKSPVGLNFAKVEFDKCRELVPLDQLAIDLSEVAGDEEKDNSSRVFVAGIPNVYVHEDQILRALYFLPKDFLDHREYPLGAGFELCPAFQLFPNQKSIELIGVSIANDYQKESFWLRASVLADLAKSVW